MKFSFTATVIIFVAAIFAAIFWFRSPIFYNSAQTSKTIGKSEEATRPRADATHVKTPEPLKAIYMTSFVAGDKKRRAALVKLIEDTELNSVVIDIKDYSGTISFKVSDPILSKIGAAGNRISDADDFIESLHKKGIYVIGRIAVFQDPKLVAARSDWAVVRASDWNIWRDKKGIAWIDVAARESWEYFLALAKESYSLGFDEINFDYVRFPSDGNMNDIAYPWSGTRVKTEVLDEFFMYLADNLRPFNIPISVDFFGMTTTNRDDLRIGQVLEVGLAHFDFVSPMVYPSHYPDNFIGIANPASEPYRVIRYSMDKAFARASTTPQKVRPWLQDFDLGADYTPEMVRAEIQAVYDSGFTSWMLWSPANKYTESALLRE